MSGTTSKRDTRTTLGPHKRAHGAPANLAGWCCDRDIIVGSGPTAASVEVKARDTCVGGPVARSSGELLDAIDEVVGPETDGEAVPAPVFAHKVLGVREML
ncbi:hypothetical protein ON010_g14943 [Phytophthora cinnamomi]|nr:hypothetical protein ON010_g14943 [Phytophthora cinnamomi]